MVRTRAALLASAFTIPLIVAGMAPFVVAGTASAQGLPRPGGSGGSPRVAGRTASSNDFAQAFTPGAAISEIRVEGNQRIEEGTIRSYMLVAPGDQFDSERLDRSLKTLYATGLFSDVVIRRQANVLIVRIAENPIVNRILFEGNKKINDDNLRADLALRPRVYVERIDIEGNARTKDNVIRREFRLAEGDAFNAALLRRSRQRLEDLAYFSTVSVTSAPGTTADKAVVNARVEEKATGELTIGGGYSTDAGALANLGVREHNLIGTGVDAGINTVLAQKRTQIDVNLTDPYFLDRNLVATFNPFAIQSTNLIPAQYDERRVGFAASIGYEFSEYLRQAWTYTLVQRRVYNVLTGANLYVQDEAGTSLLSQISQTLSLDFRDSKLDPRNGSIYRLGTDFAGLGGNVNYVRTKLDGTYYIPLEHLLGDPDYVIALSAGAGYLFSLGSRERIIDRFFLGGDNLRGFQTGGAGPHGIDGGDSLGGRFIWTQSSELRFPLPLSPDLGLSGRTFFDIGALSGLKPQKIGGVYPRVADYAAPRMGAGVGVSWKTPFGLINIDIAPFVVKQKYDQTQIFRFGFGTRF